MKNYYEILEVSEDASYDVIEHAYKALEKQYENNSNLSSFEKNEFKRIQEAYYILSNPRTRSEYNLKIGNISGKENEKKSKKLLEKKFNKRTSVLKNIPSFKEMGKTVGTLLYNETKKNKKERSKDLYALILTIVIIAAVIFLFFKIPALNRILFPEL